MMLDSIFSLDRNFKRAYHALLKSGHLDESVRTVIENFLTAYVNYNELKLPELIKGYQDFIIRYSEDLSLFKQDNKYPFERDSEKKSIEREVYDVALILSTFVSPVRHFIMKELKYLSKSLSGSVALVGIGSGLDLEIINKFSSSDLTLEAYDITLNAFVPAYFEKVTIHEQEFKEQSHRFNTIVAIELLEHLENPVDFVRICKNSLTKGGKLVFTTATDMPQFDHLQKFNDDSTFIKELRTLGLKIVRKTDYFHNYLGGPASAKNTWYECYI